MSPNVAPIDTIAQNLSFSARKRVLDLICIVFALPVLLPLMLIIAAAIKLTSRGPVIFRQERIGYLGRPFTCWKFRTMKVEAPSTAHESYLRHLVKSSQPMTKQDLKGDSRVIPILGSLLRATGLDELPQLFNVLRGEMGIVGPRPCIPCEYQEYLPWHMERFNTLPGLTGLWQVSGKNRTTFEQMIRLDIYYARNESVGLDLKIMAKTIPVLTMQVVESVASRWPAFNSRTYEKIRTWKNAEIT